MIIRPARASDLPALVALLVEDGLGAGRDDASLPLDPCYAVAFRAIDADPNQLLAVATDEEDVVGTLHLTFIPGLARRGTWRADIKAVRIAAARRGGGLGGELLAWAIGESQRRRCGLVQLATDRSRVDAHRFYERFGFTPSHVGYKLALD